MLIRNFVPGDAEHWVEIHNLGVAPLADHRPLTLDEARRRSAGAGFDPGTHFFAEEENQVVGHASFDPLGGQVTYPWCKPGHERLANPLFTSVLRTMAQRKIARAVAAYPAAWTEIWEFFEDHNFAKIRDVINYSQSIGDLPTMFQRPGLNVTPLQPGDLPEIERLAPGVLRLEGDRLADYFLRNPRFPADALFVLRRKEGGVKGVGLMIDDASLDPVGLTDPMAADFRFGSFGTEGCHGEGVNGLFSFIAAPGKDAEIVGQDLLWYATSRAATNSFEELAAQAPGDMPHFCAFYNRYFRKQGSFPVYGREIGGESHF